MSATETSETNTLKERSSVALPEKRAKAASALPTDACGQFAGQLQILGFGKLRRHLGAKWPKYKSKIHVAVENIISTNLGPKDMSSRVGQDHYILIFDDSTTPEQAEETSLNIARKIREVFVGESQSDLIEVKSQVGKIQQTDLNDIIFAPLPDRPAKLADKKDAELQKAKPAEEVKTKRSSEKVSAVDNDLATRMLAVSKIEEKRRSLYEIEYVPFWNIHNEVLTGYAVTAVSRKAVGPPILEHNVLRAGATQADIQKLDTHLLKTQIEVAAELYQNDFTSLLTSQVHFDTLSSASGREEVLKIARQIPASLKPILMIEIVGIPDHTPPSTVAQRTSGLNTLFRALTVRIPKLDFAIADCVAMGATAVAYQIPQKYNLPTLMSGIKKLTKDAKAARLLTTFEFVPNVDVAAALKDAGAVFVSGAFLGGPFDTPGNMKKLTVRQVRQGPISPY